MRGRTAAADHNAIVRYRTDAARAAFYLGGNVHIEAAIMPFAAGHAFSATVLRRMALLLTALVAGCAAVDRHPTLNYPDATASDAQAAAPKNKQIILNPFLDHRGDKSNVGTVKSAFGLRTTEVVPANDVSVWVIEGIKTELQNNGYVVTLGSSSKDTLPGASAAVSGVIVDVTCDSGHSGKVAVIGKVRKGNKEVLSKNYSAHGSAGFAMMPTAEACAKSLSIALAASVKRFVAELDGMLTSSN